VSHYEWPEELKPIDLSRMIVGWAKNGGPLAVANGNGSVYIFLSDGRLYNKPILLSHLLTTQGTLLSLSFSCKEDLILLYSTGTICIIDIVTITVKW